MEVGSSRTKKIQRDELQANTIICERIEIDHGFRFLFNRRNAQHQSHQKADTFDNYVSKLFKEIGLEVRYIEVVTNSNF